MNYGGGPGAKGNILQAHDYFHNGIICENGIVYFLELNDILTLLNIDDSTYHYTINSLNSENETYDEFNKRRATIIATVMELTQRIILSTEFKDLKLKYIYMGYHQLMPEINEVLKVNDMESISVSTLVRIMREFNIKTFWERNYVKRANYGTKNGKTDSRYVAPNRRALLLYENQDDWNDGNVVHSGNLQCKFQVICSDIKYHGYGLDGKKVYETNFYDEMTKSVVGHCISTGLTAEQTSVEALKDLIRNYPDVDFTDTLFHSDRGSQYTCKIYHDAILKIGGLISMSPAGKPNYNPHAENMFSLTSKNTKQLLKEIKTEEEAIELLKANIRVNNFSKTKEALDYMTSSQFAAITPTFQDKRLDMATIYNSIILAA